jgi:hypothetical protein
VVHQRDEGVVVTGVYGTGKTTAVEEMADMLEEAEVPYAAFDLDWLAWANVDDHGPVSHRLMMSNVRDVVANAREAGMTRFLFAGSLDDPGHVADLGVAAAMPIRVVRLTAPIDVIARRLAPSPTTGRQGDLATARAAVAAGTGDGIGDLVVDTDRPVRLVAEEILGWLGWLPPR